MILVIAEKPSVAQSIAAALGVKEKKDGYIEGGGYLISWCVGAKNNASQLQTFHTGEDPECRSISLP